MERASPGESGSMLALDGPCLLTPHLPEVERGTCSQVDAATKHRRFVRRG
jgi:hypothetical protein